MTISDSVSAPIIIKISLVELCVQNMINGTIQM